MSWADLHKTGSTKQGKLRQTKIYYSRRAIMMRCPTCAYSGQVLHTLCSGDILHWTVQSNDHHSIHYRIITLLPSTSKKELLLLLHCLYACSCEVWIQALAPLELNALGKVSKTFECTGIMRLVDGRLVEACKGKHGVYLPDDAPKAYKLAQQLGLASLQAYIGEHMGRKQPSTLTLKS